MFVRTKQTRRYKLVKLGSFTGFRWCCRLSIPIIKWVLT